MPAQCSVKQVHILHRHGARYPTADASTANLATALKNATRATFTGPLAFLNGFTYKLGAEILVPVGRQQLFDSGVQASYQYKYLYNTSAPKIVARTTSQDRILKSAEYWLAGFFGFEWTNYANLEVIIENAGFNNSLASYDTCTNNSKRSLYFRDLNDGTDTSQISHQILLPQPQLQLGKVSTLHRREHGCRPTLMVSTGRSPLSTQPSRCVSVLVYTAVEATR